MISFQLGSSGYKWEDNGVVLEAPANGISLSHKPPPLYLKLKNIPDDWKTRREFFQKIVPGFHAKEPFYLVRKEKGTLFHQSAPQEERIPLYLFLSQVIDEERPLLIVLNGVTEVVYISRQKLLIHTLDWKWEDLVSRLPKNYHEARLIGEVIIPEFFDLMGRLESFRFKKLHVFGLLSGLTGLEDYLIKRLNLSECSVIRPGNCPLPEKQTLSPQKNRLGYGLGPLGQFDKTTLVLFVLAFFLIQGNQFFLSELGKIRGGNSYLVGKLNQGSKKEPVNLSRVLALLEESFVSGVHLSDVQVLDSRSVQFKGHGKTLLNILNVQQNLLAKTPCKKVFLKNHQPEPEGGFSFSMGLECEF